MYKNDVLYTLFTSIIIYFLITYIFGLITGFQKNGYSLRLYDIIKNMFSTLLLFIMREIYRYIYFSKCKKNVILVILGGIFFVLLDINLNISEYDIFKTLGLTKMICLVVFPSISKTILLSYITTKVGFGNCIFYFF